MLEQFIIYRHFYNNINILINKIFVGLYVKLNTLTHVQGYMFDFRYSIQYSSDLLELAALSSDRQWPAWHDEQAWSEDPPFLLEGHVTRPSVSDLC